MNNKFRKFIVVWFGQFVSILGSGISSFGLSIWIYMMTKSATSFAMTFFVQMLPGIIFAPLAGTLADRKNRKYIIILTDSLDAVLKIVLIILFLTGKIKVWMVYPITFLSQTLGTFQNPAFNASIPLLVEKKDISRANGFMQLIMAIQGLLAPLIAGSLYPFIGLAGLFTIDFISFFVAILTILPQKIEHEIEELKDSNLTKTMLTDMKLAMNLLREKEGFLQIIKVFSLINFIANLAIVLLGPMVMGNFDTKIYGIVNSLSGAGMIVGGVLSGVIPVQKHKVRSIYMSIIICSLGLIIAGVNYHWLVIAIGILIFSFPLPYANATFGSLLHLKIENNMLGRVGSLINAFLKILSPIATLLAGILADHVFEPLLMENGKLANTFIADLIGIGKGRGIGLLFIICGLMTLITCVIMLLKKDVDYLEEKNPDVI
ncbi:MAG: MFS transporter [Lagierella massiliensis]|nr:MFS transporter [Lagierella massiliensis]